MHYVARASQPAMMGIAAASCGGLRHVPRSRTVAWRSAVGVGGSEGEGVRGKARTEVKVA